MIVVTKNAEYHFRQWDDKWWFRRLNAKESKSIIEELVGIDWHPLAKLPDINIGFGMILESTDFVTYGGKIYTTRVLEKRT